tara:strand:- start:210 stop:677 length:468 start_codon:yes stop_codon:yes gene_type:complete
MKENLDYLLDNPATCQVWVDFKICKTNPMHDDYLRYDSVEITLEQANKIAFAKCNSVVLEFPDKDYTLDWNDNRMPELESTKVRMWNSQAWAVMNQRRAKESKKIEERTARLEFVIRYFIETLEREPSESRTLAYALSAKDVDSLAKMAAKALKA